MIKNNKPTRMWLVVPLEDWVEVCGKEYFPCNDEFTYYFARECTDSKFFKLKKLKKTLERRYLYHD